MARVKEATAKAVASESKYQRAAAKWVANYLGHTSASAIYGVNFFFEDGYHSYCCGYDCDGWHSMDTSGTGGLEFQVDGHRSYISFYDIGNVGEFIEQCAALLDE